MLIDTDSISWHNLRHRSSGFTILEILTAMVVLSVVVTLVFGSFNTVFSSADRVNVSSDIYEMGNACLTRITKDLKGAHVLLYPRYKPPGIDDDPDIYRIESNNENIGGEKFAKLRFTSLTHLPTQGSATDGIAEIVYYPEDTEDRGVVIKRRDTLYPYPEFEESESDPVMCEWVHSFELILYDQEGEEYTEWDSEDEDYEFSTPRTIGIKLVIIYDEQQYEFSTEIIMPAFRFKPVKI
jgi:prepilin-type N-terminal cleavage/methylation domain-containing protein